MLSKNTLKSLLISSLITFVYILYYDIYDIIAIIAIFISSFVLVLLWLWAISILNPVKITKEEDEILHPVTETENVLHVSNIKKYYEKEYNPKSLEKCDCGSTLFRIYNKDIEKGTHIQFICAKCNKRRDGIEFNWKVKIETEI